MQMSPKLPVTLAVAALVGFAAFGSPSPGVSSAREAGDRKPIDLEDGLVGYWRFDGSADVVADSSGNGNDGIFVNGAPGPGRIGQAAELLGRDDSHVSIKASTSLDGFTDQITVTAWVFPNSLPADYRVIASRQIGTQLHPDQFYLGFGPDKGVMHYKWHLGTMEDGKVNDRSIYTGVPEAGRWIHMAGVYNGKKMHLYVDGERIGSQEQSGKIQVDDNPVTIGGEENGAESLVVDGEFDGRIDEVRLYNRALGPARDQGDLQAGAALGRPDAAP